LAGVQVMTARAVGEGRQGAAGAVLRRGVAYGLWIGVLSSIFLALVGPAFLHGVGLQPDLADGASRVLLAFSLSLTPYTLWVAAAMWLEALSRPRAPMVMMWIANALNLAIDLVLVPGHFGLPAMGAVGGACATLGSRSVLMVVIFAYIARLPEARAMGVFERPPRDRPAEIEQRRIGYGSGASNFFEVAAFAAMNIVTGWLGGAAVAAWTIILNVTSLVFMAPLGFSGATAVRVGAAYGARDLGQVNRSALLGALITSVMALGFSLAIWPLATFIAGAYTRDAAVIALATNGLVMACIFFLPDALQIVGAQSLRARGDVWPPTLIQMFSYTIVMSPLAWALAFPAHMGLTGVMLATIIASVLSAVLQISRLIWLGRRGL
ncbi:MAG: MATE family efflux transporter, partial [Caulobacteraceae bacterium]|nr:MATE family efflux transporter [Caulobacteraceae bacterium]